MRSIDLTFDDIAFFDAIVRTRTLSAAARELQVGVAAVSKRLLALENKLGIVLLVRSTRRLSLTEEGDRLIRQGRAMLNQRDEMVRGLRSGHETLRGLLRVNASLGFGRSHVAPLLSSFAREHPQVDVQLELTVDPPPISQNAFDVCIRFGAPPDARLHAYLLTRNVRVLCASPAYLAKHQAPTTPSELTRHRTIAIRQGETAYGVWRLTRQGKTETVKVHGALSSNDGEVAVNWALDGHGIVMRAHWDVRRYLDSGRLVQILHDWQTPDADLYAVVPTQHNSQPRVRRLVEHLRTYFVDSRNSA